MRTRTKLVAAALTGSVILLGGLTAASASGGGRPNGGGGSVHPRTGVLPAVATPTSTEATLVPIQPCRIADTRIAGGVILHTATRTFHVTGTTGFTAQGGTAAGCGIPASATAVSLSATAVNETSSGNVIIFPAGAPKPLTAVSSFTHNVTLTGFTTAALGTGGQVTAGLAGPANINLVLDVSGYYAPQMAGYVESDGTLVFSSGRVVSSSRASTGNYDITFDRDVSQCSFQVTPFEFNYVVAVGPTGGAGAHVYIHDQGSTITHFDTSFFINAIC